MPVERPLGLLSSRIAAGFRSALTVAVVGVVACRPAPPAYRPRTRAITVTTVPLLVKESARTFPFLKDDFGPDGILAGKEVYGFSPATIVVGEGDTLDLTIYNPEDDAHTFVLPDLSLALPGEKITHASYIARHAGIYPIVCDIASHAPMMNGQLIVLAPAALAATDSAAAAATHGGP